MSTVYVVTHETDSEGGWVVAVCATLEGAKAAAERDRHEPASPLKWEACPLHAGMPPTWMASREREHAVSGYEIAQWSVDAVAPCACGCDALLSSL